MRPWKELRDQLVPGLKTFLRAPAKHSQTRARAPDVPALMSSFCSQETWKKLLDKPQHFSQNPISYPQNCCSSHTIWKAEASAPNEEVLGQSPLGLCHPLSLREPKGSNGCTHFWSISPGLAQKERGNAEWGSILIACLHLGFLSLLHTVCPFLTLFWSLCLLVFEIFSSLCLFFSCFLCPYFILFLFFYLHLLSSLFPSSPPTPFHFLSTSSFVLGI